jgi:cytochrome c-type biogenesis protein CcmH/NrfF
MRTLACPIKKQNGKILDSNTTITIDIRRRIRFTPIGVPPKNEN